MSHVKVGYADNADIENSWLHRAIQPPHHETSEVVETK